MFITVGAYGHLDARPMHAYLLDDSSDESSHIWFFTNKESEIARQVEKNSNVNLSFSNSKNETYLSLMGKAHLTQNRKQIEALWNPLLLAWFPKGLEDPNLSLIKVEPMKAELWENSVSSIITLFGMTKSILQGEVYKGGKDSHISVSM